jgi:putative transposase
MPWAQWLQQGLTGEEAQAIRQATRTGRPCGSQTFVRMLEDRLDRLLAPQKRGPKPKTSQGEELFTTFGTVS